jgi:predicted AAA+ superfamily ATPase
MILRPIARLLKQRLAQYPAVCLLGPRQSGKTTLARSFGGAYFDLEQESDRLRLDLQWSALAAGKKLVVLDEAQAWPEVFPRLRGAIDEARSRKGRFLLLGSVSPALTKHVSESLAGRLSLVELPPFLLNELPAASLDDLWLRGGYPEGGILEPRRFPQWQRDYLTLLAQRDLPNWGLPAKPQMTQRLLRMVAAVHGQLWNASQIAQSLGLSYATVNTYMDKRMCARGSSRGPGTSGEIPDCFTPCLAQAPRTTCWPNPGSGPVGKALLSSKSSAFWARPGNRSSLTSSAPATSTRSIWFWISEGIGGPLRSN